MVILVKRKESKVLTLDCAEPDTVALESMIGHDASRPALLL